MGMRILVSDDQITKDLSQCGSADRPVVVLYDLFCNTNPDDDRIQILWIDGNETTCSLVLFV